MIKSSFCFLPRVSLEFERKIWTQGIRNWNDFVRCEKIPGISSKRKNKFDKLIKDAHTNLHSNNSTYFFNCLKSTEMWRLWDYFKDECCYIDIERGSRYDDIILIGITKSSDRRIK